MRKIRHLIVCADGNIDLLETAFFGLNKANKFVRFEPLPEKAMDYLKTVFDLSDREDPPLSPHHYLYRLQTEITKAADSETRNRLARALSKARNEYF